MAETRPHSDGSAGDGGSGGGVRFHGVIFDLDGTLADTAQDIVTGVNLALDAHGLSPLGADRVLRHVGRGVRVLMRECLELERGTDPDSERIGGLDAAVAEFRAAYAEHLLDTTRLYPGVAGMLDRLAASGIAMAIVSNKPAEHSRRIVEGLGLAGRFRVVLGGDSLDRRKPDPTPLLHALDTLGVRRDAAVMVGDSLIDVEAAHAASMAVASVTWGFVAADLLREAGPDIVVDEPAQLADWILGQPRR